MPDHQEPSTAPLSEARQRRALFFDLRGLLGIVVLAILATHHPPVSPTLWLVGIGFLASDLLLRLLPSSWFRNPRLGYAAFFLDMGALTVVLYSLRKGETESLLLYYLTVFIATMGAEARRSVGIAVVVGALYVWLHLSSPESIWRDPERLMRIPLFFLTAVSFGYLAEQARARERQVRSLKAIQKGLKGRVEEFRDDLAESELLRAAAEAAEERFRNLVQDVDAIVWEMDPSTFQFTFVSQRAEQILGYPAQRWLSELDFWINHVVPEDRERVSSISRNATAEGRDFNIEYRAFAADGRVVWLRDLLRVIHDTEGQIVQLRGVMVDITELKRAEDTLEWLRRQNELLLNSAGEGIFGLDLNGQTSFINPAAARMLGWEVEELIGKRQHDVIHYKKPDGTLYPIEKCPIYSAFKDGAIHRVIDEIFWRKDGTSFPVEYVSTPIRERGEVVGAVVVFKDITERKQLEEQFRQAQKMEAVGRLAGGVAHDFNNLLTIIGGYSQLLLSRLAPSDEAREQVQEIKKAGDRAGALTRQLLAFSRRQVLAPQVLDLNVVVANLEKMLCRLIGEDIELVARAGPGLGTVKADPSQIEQVVMNLVVNARDAMPAGGTLIVETANVDLDEAFSRSHPPTVPGRYLMLAVTDTGIGMDAETRAHIFEPFFTTKERGKGTGLGLATVYGIVKQSGGYIWVESAPGKGSAFRIYLPRVDQVPGIVEAARTRSGLPLGSETILLVEDEDGVRALVRGILKSSGYAVLEASTPGEALLICQRYEGPIHLLLTDVVMPEKDGPELAEQLAILRPETKVLYMSGYTDDAILQHGVLGPGIALLQKPFTPESLARKIREVLDTMGRHRTHSFHSGPPVE